MLRYLLRRLLRRLELSTIGFATTTTKTATFLFESVRKKVKIEAFYSTVKMTFLDKIYVLTETSTCECSNPELQKLQQLRWNQ